MELLARASLFGQRAFAAGDVAGVLRDLGPARGCTGQLEGLADLTVAEVMARAAEVGADGKVLNKPYTLCYRLAASRGVKLERPGIGRARRMGDEWAELARVRWPSEVRHDDSRPTTPRWSGGSGRGTPTLSLDVSAYADGGEGGMAVFVVGPSARRAWRGSVAALAWWAGVRGEYSRPKVSGTSAFPRKGRFNPTSALFPLWNCGQRRQELNALWHSRLLASHGQTSLQPLFGLLRGDL